MKLLLRVRCFLLYLLYSVLVIWLPLCVCVCVCATRQSNSTSIFTYLIRLYWACVCICAHTLVQFSVYLSSYLSHSLIRSISVGARFIYFLNVFFLLLLLRLPLGLANERQLSHTLFNLFCHFTACRECGLSGANGSRWCEIRTV